MTISNRLGLHARPAMMLAECASEYSCAITIRRSDADEVIDAKSIMQLLMLAGTCGTRLEITAEGGDARQALDALAALVESGFDDE